MLLRADSLASTHAIAAAIAGLARAGDIIVLAGEMGAGKTAFAQGFGRALGITEAITSPTFTLVHSHSVPGSKLVLHHADLYRLDSTGDVDDLALHELAEFGGVVLIEWGDVAASTLGDHLEVRLGRDDIDDRDDPEGTDDDGDDDGDDDADDDFGLDEARSIEVHAVGPAWAGRWDRLRDDLEAYRC
jgi:tRNA threonylcarbamoyladenosine biosynthesis protein TsaE